MSERFHGALAALLLAACTGGPRLATGAQCELNSECDVPLVCRLGRCRTECAGARDCAAGLYCVRDNAGLGACVLEDERECTLNSDCPEPLICASSRCVNECETSRDCTAGSACLPMGDSLACVDTGGDPCVRNSDCQEGYVCGPDQRCRAECVLDRDCPFGFECVLRSFPQIGEAGVCEPLAHELDGGAPDAGGREDAATAPDAGASADASTPADASAPADASPPLDASAPADADNRDASAAADATTLADASTPPDAAGG